MAGLLIVGVVVAVIALYLADRFIKARAQARRLRDMDGRLAAAAARVDEQQAEKRAVARASAELTNVMPAINRPPLSLPDMPARGPARSKPSCERPAPADHGTHSPATGRPGRRGGRTGDHGSRPSERSGA
jgi:type II secretory pathway pseudopilin PulG